MKRHVLRLIGGEPREAGVRVSSDVLLGLLAGLKDGAQKALRFRVEGQSVRKGPKPGWLEAAGTFDVTGLAEGSTFLELEAPTLGELLPDAYSAGQDALFEPDSRIDRDDSALDVFADTLRSARSGDRETTFADRALLDACYAFSKLTRRYDAIEFFSSQEKPVVRLEQGDIGVLHDLVESTPESHAVRVTGRLDTISASRPMAVLVLADGTRVRAFIQDHHPDPLRALFGQLVLVSGIASYRPSGKIGRVEVEFFRAAEGPDEALWARAPRPSGGPPLFDAVPQDPSSGVGAFFDTWPGEESDHDLLEALKKLG